MRLGQPRLAGQECAGADLRRSQRALVKDDFEQALIDFGRQRVRMMRRLRLPYRGELLLDQRAAGVEIIAVALGVFAGFGRSEEHTSELQSLMRISYAVFC